LPENAGNLMDVLDFYYAKIPVLGICLGHQAIGAFFDGDIIKAQKPMHGKLSQIVHFGDDIF
jgi:anthranilate/para-aminobenzoate synthase component II